MFVADWSLEKGWEDPQIIPRQNLSLDPACSVFHYATECFEGMKAYKDSKGGLRLFRPDLNVTRLNNSAERVVLPKVDPENFLNCLKELIKVDSNFVPQEKGFSLYIRPTLIGTQPSLGVAISNFAKLFIVLSPVGPYFPTGWKPTKLIADDRFVRSAPGGTGENKVGANYAGGMLPMSLGSKQGFSQVLWLYGTEKYITEAGTMNFFLFWINEKGEKELLTPSLEDHLILPGVTRDSIIQLTREWNEFKVTEGHLTMYQLIKALEEDRVIEAFGAGTAAVVSPVELIEFHGVGYKIPIRKGVPGASIGVLAERLAASIFEIQYGEKPHKWSVKI